MLQLSGEAQRCRQKQRIGGGQPSGDRGAKGGVALKGTEPVFKRREYLKSQRNRTPMTKRFRESKKNRIADKRTSGRRKTQLDRGSRQLHRRARISLKKSADGQSREGSGKKRALTTTRKDLSLAKGSRGGFSILSRSRRGKSPGHPKGEDTTRRGSWRQARIGKILQKMAEKGGRSDCTEGGGGAFFLEWGGDDYQGSGGTTWVGTTTVGKKQGAQRRFGGKTYGNRIGAEELGTSIGNAWLRIGDSCGTGGWLKRLGKKSFLKKDRVSKGITRHR